MTALRRRLLGDMQVRQLSPHTQRADVNNIGAVCTDILGFCARVVATSLVWRTPLIFVES